MSGAPYTVTGLIRRRGPVEVLAASDISGGKVVLKRLDARAALHDPVGAARFRREQAIGALLDHPGIVRNLAAGENWLALEWLDRGLDDRACRRDFAEPAALREMLAALSGTLAYVHARGVVHADLKPAHVRFRGETPVLIDFGIAALGSGDPLSAEEFAGSPRWMAPERIGGAAPLPASDVWSLCAIAAWLASGAPGLSGDAGTILDERRRAASMHVPSPDRLAGPDPSLHSILSQGLGPASVRPSAAQLVQAISRSTAG